MTHVMAQRLRGRGSARAAVTALLLAVLTLRARAQRWSEERAAEWYAARPWIVGCNYIPAYAVNQLDMFQAATFNATAIDAELVLAATLGFTALRVYLHDLLWLDDPDAFLARVDTFLGVAERHGMATMLVLTDGVWNPAAALGPQPDPIPHTHNSQWVQSPGRAILSDPARHDELKPYVVGVMERFRNDSRVLLWDLFNEPDNPGTLERQPHPRTPACVVLNSRVPPPFSRPRFPALPTSVLARSP